MSDLSTNYVIRIIDKSGFHKQYLELLQYLTIINPSQISKTTFEHFIDNLNEQHIIYVIEDIAKKIIIGTITLLVENKIIHNMGKVAHIEDTVVHPNYRGQQLGKFLINIVVKMSEELKCYKIILDCKDENRLFYEKCGFNHKGNQMSLYF
jgi:glucosamine-phosphate N-acetyltransferase